MNGDFGEFEWLEKIQALTLKNYDAVNNGALTVFENSNCIGHNRLFHRDNEKDRDLLMNENDLKGEFTFGSVMMPPGYELVTYEDGQFVVQNDLLAPKGFLTKYGQQECHNLKENF